MGYLAALARILLGLFFVLAGVSWAMAPDLWIEKLSHTGMGYPREVFWAMTIAQLVGGGLLVVGLMSRLAALLTLVCIVAISFTVHDFWNYPETSSDFELQKVLFGRSMTTVAALLLIIAHGSGPFSIGKND